MWNIFNIFYSLNDNTTHETFGIHWYNGDNLTKQYINEFNKNGLLSKLDFNKTIWFISLFVNIVSMLVLILNVVCDILFINDFILPNIRFLDF